MNRILLPIILIVSIAVQGFSQVAVNQTQMPLITKKTATWCNPCGTWGWDLFKYILNEHEDNSVVFEMHNSTSSDLYNATAKALHGQFEYKGSTPIFYVNGINEVHYENGGILVNGTKDNIADAVDSVSQLNPIVNAGFNASISGDTMYVDTKVKFFQSATGEFYLGVYVIEHEVIAYQNGQGNNAVHTKILRDALTTDDLGDLVSSGMVSANSEFDNSYTYVINSSWNLENLSVFVVIWEKNGSDYTYVNAYSDNQKVTPDDITTIGDIAFVQLEVYPNPTNNLTVIEGELRNTTVELYNLNGQLLQTIWSDNHRIELNMISYAEGPYWIKVTDKDGKLMAVKQFIRQ